MTKNMNEAKDNAKNKIFEALSALVPEQERGKLTEAVTEFLDEAVASLDSEYDTNLQEAFAQVAKEKEEIEKTALQGYNEAYEMIQDYQNRLEKQLEEFNAQMEEGYGEAYEKILEERKKNEDLELALYEQFETKRKEDRELLVDKIDEFLNVKEKELHEMAKQEILNDPSMLEHKLAWDKVLNIATDWLSDEDYSTALNGKLEDLDKQISEHRNQIKALEAKNARVTAERDKLNEQIRSAQTVITEQTTNVRNEKKKNAEGRGVMEPNKSRQEIVVIKEEVAAPKEPAKDFTVIEEQWQKLAGV